MEQNNKTFTYTFSAKQQEEVKAIRQKYLPPQEDKMEQLRRLDRSAAMPGTAAAIGLGVTSTLVLGIGMCCTMVWEQFFALGVVVGILGLVGIALAYPTFLYLTKKQRQKLAPRIMQLTSELMGQE